MKTQNFYGLSLCILATVFLLLTSCDNDDYPVDLCSRSISAIEATWENPVPSGTSVMISLHGNFHTDDVLQLQTRTTGGWQTIQTWNPAGMRTGPEVFTLEISDISQTMQVRALTTGCEGRQIFTNAVTIEIEE